MYGEGSYISIDLLDYIRSKKSYLVHAKLYLTDVEDGMKLYPEGVHMLINLGWKVVGQGKPVNQENLFHLKRELGDMFARSVTSH